MIDDFQRRNICIVGMARSGMAAAQVLAQRNASVTLCDSRGQAELEPQIEQARSLGIACAVGTERAPDGTQLLITSPGVRRSAPILADAQTRGIVIWSEIEAAYRICAAPIIAVTGTNGKTTTCALLAEIGKAAGIPTYLAGNIAAGEIALPLIRAAHESKADELVVAEISSFQLEWIDAFRPRVAIITNITVDHSDRQSWDEYVAAKWRIFENQRAGDTSVLRSDVPTPVAHPAFSYPEGSTGSSQPGSPAVVCFDKLPRPDWLKSLRIRGEHNRENAMAALAAARAFGVDDGIAERACLAFNGVVHRLEYVLTDARGAAWINNSMCTNNDAFARSLDAIEGPKIVLAGGVYKGGATEPFGAAAADKSVKLLICYGKSGPMLAEVARAAGAEDVRVVDTLRQGAELAARRAVRGETVLLSPACASFDQFKDFEDRGEQFKALARALAQQQFS